MNLDSCLSIFRRNLCFEVFFFTTALWAYGVSLDLTCPAAPLGVDYPYVMMP